MSAENVLAQSVEMWTSTLDGPSNVAKYLIRELKDAGYVVVSSDDLARVVYQLPPFTAITEARERLESAIGNAAEVSS